MKRKPVNNHISIEKPSDPDSIIEWMEGFILDRKAMNVSPNTIVFYIDQFKNILEYTDELGINKVNQITTTTIREFLIWMRERGHNDGGVNQGYRVCKAFLRWYEDEAEPEDWRNPIRKIKAPTIGKEILEPIPDEYVNALLDSCEKDTVSGSRDKAIMLTLLDTGIRSFELCALNIGDLDQITGTIVIRKGKGRKPRTVFIGKKTRKVIRTYLKERTGYFWNNKSGNDCCALFLNRDNERLTYSSLDNILDQRCKQIGIPKQKLHAFRRTFVIKMIRAEVDIIRLMALTGHADTQVLVRYAKTNTDDAHNAFMKGSPVDNLI